MKKYKYVDKKGKEKVVILPPMLPKQPHLPPKIDDIKPAIIGMGDVKIHVVKKDLELDRKSTVIKALIVKYTERLNNLKTYDSECGESLSDSERHDLEQRIRDHAEFIRDLKSI